MKLWARERRISEGVKNLERESCNPFNSPRTALFGLKINNYKLKQKKNLTSSCHDEFDAAQMLNVVED